MAVVTFLQPVDMTTIDPLDWVGDTPVVHTRTKMVFENDDQTVTLGGTGFTYIPFLNIPLDGKIHTVEAAQGGETVVTMSGLNVDVSDLMASTDDPEAVSEMFFGGDDQMTGSAGADVLFGFGGNDTLKGGRGADVIGGGEGKDILIGAGGIDVFTFVEATDSTLTQADRIKDLTMLDVIDLSQIGVEGDIDAVYQSAKDRTVFNIDVDGDGKADMRIFASGDIDGFLNFVT